jgi:capsular polysaccharide transport system permease protein
MAKSFFKKISPIFLGTVVLPTLLAIVYYGLVASDVYISESRFVVRSPQKQQQASVLGALFQGTGFSRSQDDTYSVHDFVLSRDALAELDKTLSVRAAYTSKSVDFINRFPGLDWDDSFEAFFKYYKRRVSVDYDTVSSITTLTVRAYSAEDSKKINDLLLKMGERLVNNLNDRSRQDLIRFAESEVKVAEEKLTAASLALSNFRSNQAVFDTDRQAAFQLQAVGRLREELIGVEAQLTTLKQTSPNNPQIKSLETRAASLRNFIAAESAKVTGAGASFTSKAATFERLTLEKGFADRQLATTMAALETARSEAQRKQLYLERLVQPNLPDKAMEPRRIRSVFMIFVLGLVAWGVLSLVYASVKEHTDN